MKILRVISSTRLENGGPINGLINSTAGLVKLGHSIEVACLDDPRLAHLKKLPFKTYAFSSKWGVLMYSSAYKNWAQQNIQNYDLVIIHGLWQYHSYITAKYCQQLGVPYFLFVHGMLDPWFNTIHWAKTLKKKLYWWAVEKGVVANADQVLFTSETEKELARTSFWPYRARERVVSYGCSVPSVQTNSLLEKFYTSYPDLKGKKFGLFLSRIHEKKGLDLLVHALPEIVDEFPDLVIVIAGPDSVNLKQSLVASAESLGVSGNLKWVGMLQGDFKWGALAASDFFILPSHQENFGIAVAEALAMQTPVLISDKVNIWQEISAYRAGLVEADTLEGVVQLLQQWLSLSQSEQDRMSINAGKCYNENYSMDAAIHDLNSLINDYSAKK